MYMGLFEIEYRCVPSICRKGTAALLEASSVGRCMAMIPTDVMAIIRYNGLIVKSNSAQG